MTDIRKPNQVIAFDRVDEFDDIIHSIHEFPETIPAAKIRPLSGETAKDYVWMEHMDINPITGEVSVDRLPNMDLRPSNGEYHPFPFVVAATDGLNVTLQDVMFEVGHVYDPPFWLAGHPSTITVVEGTAFTYQFMAVDPEEAGVEGDEPKPPLYTIHNAPEGFNLSADGLLTAIAPENATQNIRNFTFSVRVTSLVSGLSVEMPFVLQVTNDNNAPAFTSSPIFNTEPGQWQTTITAYDRENDAPVRFELVIANGFSLTNNVLSRTFPSNPDTTPVEYTCVVRAISGTGNREKRSEQDIVVRVTELPNEAPVWETPAGRIAVAESGSAFTFNLIARDTELVSYALIGGSLPNGVSLSQFGVLSGTLPIVPSGVASFDFTVTASDGVSTVPRTFSLDVKRTNAPPVWNTGSGLLLDVWAGQPIDLQLSATDPEGGILTYAITKPSELNWLTMASNGRLTGRVPIDAVATTANIRFTVNVSDGVTTVPREFQVRIKRLAPQTVGFTQSENWIVPEGCYQMMFTWIIGAGGGGGAGHEMGHGGGGAGGGSGGFVRYQLVNVKPGDVVALEIGQGGIGFSGSAGVMGYGANGGSTNIRVNGTMIHQIAGGGGGGTSPNFNKGYISSIPGQGGSPGGLTGSAGQTGTNDKASCYGGAGARGHLIGAQGGQGGVAFGGNNYVSGPSAGKPGIGAGSGGGGGGSHDRVNSSRTYWKGGNGANGYVEFTYPSQGEVGGTAPWEPSIITPDPELPPIDGGGPIGGSCAWVEAVLPNGKRIGDVVVGDELLLLNERGDGHFKHPVSAIRFANERCYRVVTESGIEITVSDSTPMVTKTRTGYAVVDIGTNILMERVPVLDGDEFKWELVVDLVDVGVKPVALISANNGIYAAGDKDGRYIFTHNIAKQIQ